MDSETARQACEQNNAIGNATENNFATFFIWSLILSGGTA
jgi:hypothetical protein